MRRLVDAGPGLGVQALDRHAEGQHLVHEGVEELAVLVHAQQRIAEHARRERLRPHAFLGRPALRRFAEVEPLELHAGHHLEAELLGALQHALQASGAGTPGTGVPSALTNSPRKKSHVAVPGHVACGVQVQPRQRVGKAVLPAGDLRVVVGDVAAVPAEHHVAEAEAAARRRRRTCPCAGTCRAARRRCRCTATLTLAAPDLRMAARAG